MSEFSRPFALDSIGDAPRTVSISATPEECAALAVRFGLAGVRALSAAAKLVAQGDAYLVTGNMAGSFIQLCIATDEPVPASVNEAFEIRFVSPQHAIAADEIELASDDCDMMEHDGQSLDLGEAAAQTLALALNPFPRAANADTILAKAGVVGDDEVVTGPFAALKGMLGK